LSVNGAPDQRLKDWYPDVLDSETTRWLKRSVVGYFEFLAFRFGSVRAAMKVAHYQKTLA